MSGIKAQTIYPKLFHAPYHIFIANLMVQSFAIKFFLDSNQNRLKFLSKILMFVIVFFIVFNVFLEFRILREFLEYLLLLAQKICQEKYEK